MYGCLSLSNIEDHDNIFFLFTLDTLNELGYYSLTDKHKRCMEGLIETIDEEDRENIFLMDDTDIFSSNTLPCGSSTPAGVVGTIINPLRYKPCYGKVLVIRKGYIITAFMNSASRKAKSLACVMAKFFENIVLKPVAASNARKLGYEEFVKSIAGNNNTIFTVFDSSK